MSAILFGNATDIVTWAPSCNDRGTFDILSSCVITLLLCVWSAVHINVPRPGSSWGNRMGTRILWSTLALFAPGMVAFTAW